MGKVGWSVQERVACLKTRKERRARDRQGSCGTVTEASAPLTSSTSERLEVERGDYARCLMATRFNVGESNRRWQWERLDIENNVWLQACRGDCPAGREGEM